MATFWDEIKAYPKVYPQPFHEPHAVWIIAHRGASRDAPENTLAAFQLAIDQGADMIEMDVQMTSDQELVIFHDKSLRRTTNGDGRLAPLTLAEVKALDAGSWFDAYRFSDQQVPTLRETLELCAGKIMLNLEIKATSVSRDSDLLERKLLALLEEYNMIPHTMVSSFNTLTLIRIKEMESRISTALLYGNTVRTNLRPKVPIYGYQAYQMVLRTRADSLNVRKNLVTRGFLKRSRETGVRIHTFTVDSPKAMKRLIQRQINGIITNIPTRLEHWLSLQQEKGKAPRTWRR